jgi:hypothetical protein
MFILIRMLTGNAYLNSSFSDRLGIIPNNVNGVRKGGECNGFLCSSVLAAIFLTAVFGICNMNTLLEQPHVAVQTALGGMLG